MAPFNGSLGTEQLTIQWDHQTGNQLEMIDSPGLSLQISWLRSLSHSPLSKQMAVRMPSGNSPGSHWKCTLVPTREGSLEKLLLPLAGVWRIGQVTE